MSRLLDALGDVNPLLLVVTLAVIAGAGWTLWQERVAAARVKRDATTAVLRCGAGHDMTDPTNVATDDKGARRCYACKLERERNRHALRTH